MPNLTENEWVPGDLPGEDERKTTDGGRTPSEAGRRTTDDGRQTLGAQAVSKDVEAPAPATDEADRALPDVATELEVTEADPIVQAEMQAMVAEVGALVETTFDAEALAEQRDEEDAGAVPELPPLFLGDVYLPVVDTPIEAVAVAVEAALQADEIAMEQEPRAGPTEMTVAAPVTSEAEAAPPKAKRRGKKARDAKPAAEAVEGMNAARQAANEPPVMMGTLAANGELGLVALVESLLFVADGAVPVSRLAEALEIHPREVEAALAALAESYQQRGLSLQRFRDKVQLTTSPAAAALVERFLGLAASTPLSRAALEALAIVAYQQPVTRPQIESVRGVNSDSVIKNLLTKGLIEESGRAEGPGRPVLYSTTSEFMQHFGLAALSDLPPLTPPTAETPGETISELLKG